MKYFLFVFFISIYLCHHGQNLIEIKLNHGDCENAIQISGTTWGPTTAPLGPGNIIEITSKKHNKYYFETEHHTVWYTFEVNTECTLTFEIIPLNKNDDYDFVLFRKEEENFCTQMKLKKILPVRSNISRNVLAIDGKTGLSVSSDEDFVKQGVGNPFSSALKVKKGEIYYLVLDNVYDKGSGHSIVFHYRNCEEDNTQVTKPDKKGDFKLDLCIYDKESNEPISAKIDISSVYKKSGEPSDFQNEGDSCAIAFLEPKKNFTLSVKSPGYFSYQKNITTQQNKDELKLSIYLDKIEVGKKIILEDIFFRKDAAVLLPTSYPTLKNLLTILKENPSLQFEIQGHVNRPVSSSAKRDEKYLNELSEKRAKAIYDYLSRRGIDKKRMIYKGYGNSQMIFPAAKTEAEQQQNRRVEIRVMAK